jgi:hydroxymethylbilane synthase
MSLPVNIISFSSSRKIIIGSRGSDLALWQANNIKTKLSEINVKAEIKIISTQGDRTQQWNTSFEKLEGKGFFTKELEEALLNNEIDLAVHSHKDLPTESPEGLIIAAVSEREDPSELLLINKLAVDESLPFGLKKNAVTGTSSARRKSQLLSLRPDLQIKDLRGNVPTRIGKLRNGDYDAIMLAKAGVSRLEIALEEFITLTLDPKLFIPAPAQGVLALQIRQSDQELFKVLQLLNNSTVQQQIAIERKVLNLLDGGCQLPLGVYCEAAIEGMNVWVSCAKSWDKEPIKLFYENEQLEGLPEKIIIDIKNKSN